jgi:dipeptidyl-peptidase-4
VQRVQRGWQSLIDQYLVRRGFVVFRLDNRGTANRGVAFEAPLYRALGTVEVTDQLAGLDWLKKQAFVDPARIAVNGWSYGGYMVLRMLSRHPGAFAAGISGAPVTDWRLYDTHYTERFLGNPSLDPKPYTASDVVLDAGRVRDPLLVIHGLADDNVVFDNSARMLSAMQRTGVPFEFMAYPGQTHAIRDPALQLHMWRTIMCFTDRALGIAAASPTTAAR